MPTGGQTLFLGTKKKGVRVRVRVTVRVRVRGLEKQGTPLIVSSSR